MLLYKTDSLLGLKKARIFRNTLSNNQLPPDQQQ